jgi:hypothetical protein
MAKRPRGFLDSYQPRSNAELLAQVQQVLEEYRAQLPLTCRQIFYRLVGKHNYPKDERAYKRLTELLVLARRGRVIPFDEIRDDGPSVSCPQLWDSPESWLQAVQRSAQQFRLSPWPDQPRYVEVICEAGGMVPMLARVASPFGVTVRSGGGFDSLTAKHELAQHFAAQTKPVTVLHIGDFDPSGEALWMNLEEDVGAFCRAMGADMNVERLAVTPLQQREFNLPTAPAKPRDVKNRASIWDADAETVQAEALPPDLLQGILRTTLEARLDLDALEATREREAEMRESLTSKLRGLLE